MTRNAKRRPAPADLTSDSVAAMTDEEAIATAQALDESDPPSAEEMAESDRALLAALKARTSGQQSHTGTTVEELYDTLTGWVEAQRIKRRHLSQSTLLKTLELTIGWTLQTGQRQLPDIPTEEIGGDVDEPVDPPVVHERITASEEN
jgi:flagellar hook-associated protein FlgK